jgi:hypothetical protein
MDREALVTEADGHRFFAGWRSDPFFFDVTGALKDFQFTGNDYFVETYAALCSNYPTPRSGQRLAFGLAR